MREKKRLFTATWLAEVAALLLMGGCANDDDFGQFSGFSCDQFGNCSPFEGFRVLSSFPDHNSDRIPLQTEILVLFNEPVNAGSVANSVRISETAHREADGTNPAGVRTVDVTDKFSAALRDNSTLLALTPDSQLNLDADYEVTMTTGLQASSGSPLRALTHLRFTTGDSIDGGGFISIPGPPKVVRMEIWSGMPESCDLRVYVEFNEDLASVPNADYKVENVICPPFLGCSREPLGQGPFDVQPLYQGSWRYFMMYFQPYACYLDWYAAGTDINARVSSAYDRSGTAMEAPKEVTWEIGLFGGDYN